MLAYPQLARLPELRELAINDLHLVLPPNLSGILPEDGFLALRKIAITSHLFKDAFDLIQMIPSSKLSEVFIEPTFDLDLDDVMVHNMAAAWPCLQLLFLGGEQKSTLHPRVTLLCLVHLAVHCPYLDHLKLVLDATRVPEYTRPRQTRLTHTLSVFDPAYSPITDPPAVAVFLSEVFSAISFAFAVRDVPDPYKWKWGKVVELFPAFVSVRLAEMKCWEGSDLEEDSEDDTA
ncbi:hypothetical protein B0H10DRAFT_2231812 [Mycena sp. CBHHK59/15]|nr:hypothetical protein B0H10DRAFT_2231812 [Mycena sp. CBHHK59/15]